MLSCFDVAKYFLAQADSVISRSTHKPSLTSIEENHVLDSRTG